MEAFLYTLDICLVIYLCRLIYRMDKVKDSQKPEDLGILAYKNSRGQS